MTDEHRPDEDLMAQVARGRREPLDLLVRRHANGLLTFIRRMVGDQHRSEELFQDVFLAVWTSRRRYCYPRPFRPWLLGIAMNKCRADLRRRGPMPVDLDACPEMALAADGPSPVEVAIDAETAVLVAQALTRLTAIQRAVVALRVYSGLAYSEIAVIAECSETTARSHMFHALAAMRKYLEPRMK